MTIGLDVRINLQTLAKMQRDMRIGLRGERVRRKVKVNKRQRKKQAKKKNIVVSAICNVLQTTYPLWKPTIYDAQPTLGIEHFQKSIKELQEKWKQHSGYS